MHRLLIVVVSLIALAVPASAQELDSAKVLSRFLGDWQVEAVGKPSKSNPTTLKRVVHENISWTLKDRFLLAQGYSEADNIKSLWLMTYDPKSKTFPFWYFDSAGVLGGEWEGSWDETSKTLTSRATDTPKDWTSRATMQADANTIKSTAWMKDEAGTLIFDFEYLKTRLSEQASKKAQAGWSKLAADAKIAPEMKTMDWFVGHWDANLLYKPAEWTPQEKTARRTAECQWILDGRMLQTYARDSDGQESLFLLAYDPQMKTYRQWRFTSEGQTGKMTGEWDSLADVFTLKGEPRDRKSFRLVARFIDTDSYDWRGAVTDEDGKRYFHMEGRATRRKE